MHNRHFSFDKLKNKVTSHRHQNEPSILELAATASHHNNAIATNNNSLDAAGRSKSVDNGSGSVRFDTSALLSPNQPSRLRSNLNPNNNNNSPNSSTSNTQSRRGSGSSADSRSRPRSRSFVHGPSLSPSHFFRNKTKDLVKQETAQIILKKLIHMLQDLGLQNPIALKTVTQGSVSKTCKIYVSNTNDCIYLPPATSASFTYEDVDNGGTLVEQDESFVGGNSVPSSPVINPTTPTTQDSLDAPNADLVAKMKSFHSPNYLCSKIDASNPIPHTFAVIVELTKDSLSVKDLKMRFQSVTNILWPSGDSYNRAHMKEKFVIGNMEWQTTLANADYYINNSNSNDVKLKNLCPEDLVKRTREYRLIGIDDLKNASSTSLGDDSDSIRTSSTNLSTNSSGLGSTDIYKAGLYVFLLPILLPDHIPPTIISINGTLQHTLLVNFNKLSDKLNRKLKVSASYNLPMVRTPPNIANSIADKPIYVNRVWNDAVHYIITFPRKYVALGSEHVVNVKLAPLVKDVIIKRVKFNILERITYVSKNLSKEYDFDSEDPFCLHPLSKENKVRERVVSLCELKTKHKQNTTGHPDAYKEEIIKCPDNNLLYSCYEVEDDINNRQHKRKNKDTSANKSLIASPLDINIALPFLTTRSDKMIMTSAIDEDSNSVDLPLTSRRASIISDSGSPGPPNPSSPIIGALETNLVNLDEIGPHDYVKPNASTYTSDDMSTKSFPPENVQNGYTLVSRALYPDSNYRHIQINHRLQVCFRISKPDPKDDFKMHHYEVVVDTPLILLSSKCGDQSIQLPKYDDIANIFDIDPLSSSATPDPGAGPVFRTPNYNNNGITIKPLVDMNDDDSTGDLPSFEEATMTRSMSLGEDPLSRIPSISIDGVPAVLPGEPAPAYEPQAQVPSTDLLSSLNIDEIVSDENSSAISSQGQRRKSIKHSLSHSFANGSKLQSQLQSAAPKEQHTSSSSDEGSIASTLSSTNNNGQCTPPSSTAPDSTSLSSESSLGHRKIDTDENDSNSVVFLDESNVDRALTNTEESVTDEDDEEAFVDDEVSNINDSVIENDDDELGSLMTQESTGFGYEQRVPLLKTFQSGSDITINRIQRKMDNGNENCLARVSTDNVSILGIQQQGAKPQDIQRTYL
ncbi:Protein ECM21 [Candida viswanathii]|uniref:Protein ECM21 n=1 Tax=Candida viswanathii TaxID=5486 RepID=A0A367YED4_9ASCO|nr:Protein ECM21 [Candida viswanathii]